jgi:hypothetical protein
VSFRRRAHDHDEEYWTYAAAYVPFRPGAGGDLKRRLGWLETYVDRHGGTVITDFDEHRSRFRNAPFSLDKVANGGIDGSEVLDALAGENWRFRSGGRSLTFVVDKLVLEQSQLSIERARISKIVTGDSFSNIGAGAIIINRSIVRNALNRFAGPDAGTAAALRTITDHVARSGDPDAAENLEGFLEEVAREQPRKARLKTFWDGLVAVLPSVAQLGTATEKAFELLMQ